MVDNCFPGCRHAALKLFNTFDPHLAPVFQRGGKPIPSPRQQALEVGAQLALGASGQVGQLIEQPAQFGDVFAVAQLAFTREAGRAGCGVRGDAGVG